MNEFLELEEKIVEVLKTVYDPEMPVNIYDLGLIYRIETNDGNVEIDMTQLHPTISQPALPTMQALMFGLVL